MDDVKTKPQTVTATAVKTRIVELLSFSGLLPLLMAIGRTTFAQVWGDTLLRMNKTGNELVGLVRKRSCINTLVGYDYTRMVNGRRKKELEVDIVALLLLHGTPQDVIDAFMNREVVQDLTDTAKPKFVSAGLTFGDYMTDRLSGRTSKVVYDYTRKDKEYHQYMQVAILHTKTPTCYRTDTGNDLTDTEREYCRQFEPSRKSEGARQGLSKPYIIRGYDLINIRELTLDRVHYQIKG